jgi:hypothetical protein
MGLLVVSLPSSGQIPEPAPPKFTETQAPMQEMKDGRKNVMDESGRKILPENKEVMTRMAKYLTYRIAQPVYQDPEKDNPKDEKSMTRLMEEAQRWLIHSTPERRIINPRQLEYATEFAKVMDEQLRFVLANAGGKQIVRLNAVRMMAMVAKMPYPGTADALLNVINDPKESDGVKLYAYQGLRNLLAQTVPNADKQWDYIFDQPEKVAEIANVLTKVLLTPHKDMPKDPYEAAAIPFVRREVIKAVSAFHHMVIRSRPGDPLARPGLALTRAMLADKVFVPPITDSERIEALIGVCQMRPDKQIRTDVAAYAVNRTIIYFIQLETDPQARSLPWKVFGARLSVAIKEWKNNAQEVLPNSSNPKPILQLADNIMPFAKSIESAGITASIDPGAINDWEKSKIPPAPYLLFKDDKDSELWPAQ